MRKVSQAGENSMFANGLISLAKPLTVHKRNTHEIDKMHKKYINIK